MRILIVRTDRLGDLVLTLPMASAIKKDLPSSSVGVLVRDYTAPLALMCPDVDEVTTVPANTSLRRLASLLRRQKADVAFFPNSRFTLAFAAFLARIPRRVGTAYRWYSFLYTDRISDHRKSAEHHEAEYNLRMLRPLSIVAKDEKVQLQVPIASVEQVSAWVKAELGDSGFAVLHIPSGGSSKDWLIKRFESVAIKLDREASMEIVLTGTNADSEFLLSCAERIRKSGCVVHLFVGRSLEELAALLQIASIVISNSTGPGHLAAALGAPSVGLFPLPRVLSQERWGLWGQRAVNVSPPPISGCPDCAVCTCMERIEVQSVFDVALGTAGIEL